jgi:hypothetical protein
VDRNKRARIRTERIGISAGVTGSGSIQAKVNMDKHSNEVGHCQFLNC